MNRGFFYFRLTNNGNLVGEFFNDFDTSIRTESADRTNNENRFDNTYLSTWREGGNSEILNLNINISENNDRVFDLAWFRNNENNPVFRGQAMEIEESLLSGYYFVP
ncbi:hypothetical protein [uncultured Chryseobacterium sp.]|uniref:hypothetical protein n=1 Tax=uncultured Chryseobacterium sp. TaxID=259322 RepID=UPI0025FB27FD|nr:hypothetical protein [uncultured Chryseobacterium sp.]